MVQNTSPVQFEQLAADLDDKNIFSLIGDRILNA